MDKVKVGFVGCGMMGQLAHLTNFLESERCEVVALAEKREKLGRKVAEKYGIPNLYGSHEELCADDEIDAVVEITEDDLHAPIAIDLMNAGKHVFTEKPMATSLADAEKMAETAQEKNVKLMVGYMKRYDPGVEKAKEIVDDLIRSGEIGAITFVRSHCFGGDWVCNIGRPISTDEPAPEIKSRLPDWLPAELGREFKGYNNVYCHNINLLRFLVGEIKGISSVQLSKPGRYGKVVVFDFGPFLGTLETGGVSANFWDEEMKIYFEDGWIEIFTPPPLLRNVPAKVKVYKAGKIQEVITPYAEWDWSFRRADEHFLECIIEDKEPRSSGKDSMEDLRVMESIFKKRLGI